jgi:hypothetical protein
MYLDSSVCEFFCAMCLDSPRVYISTNCSLAEVVAEVVALHAVVVHVAAGEHFIYLSGSDRTISFVWSSRAVGSDFALI